MITARIISIVLGYVFGLFPTGRLVGKKNHVDLSKHGSGNTGMTNSIRVMGWKAGIIVFFGDCLKSVAAMVIIWLIYRSSYPEAAKLLELYAGLGAVLGHNFPVYAKFKGGKGIAASIGIVFAFDWRAAPICTLLFLVMVLPTHYMSLGSLAIVTAFFVQVVVFGQLGMINVGAAYLPEVYVMTAVIMVFAYIRHSSNIKRLIKGEENEFKAGSAKD